MCRNYRGARLITPCSIANCAINKHRVVENSGGTNIEQQMVFAIICRILNGERPIGLMQDTYNLSIMMVSTFFFSIIPQTHLFIVIVMNKILITNDILF